MPGHTLPTLVVILVLWFTLLVFILYLSALQDPLKKCATVLRTMKPWKVGSGLFQFSVSFGNSSL
jgi:hypothetical protein